MSEEQLQPKRKITKEERQAKALERQKEREKNKGIQDPSKFYCTNKALLEQITLWKADLDNAMDEGERKYKEEHPDATPEEIESVRKAIEDDPTVARIPEELGKMMLHIATKLTGHSKFRNYTYDLKQEMISYATFKMCQGLKNYNPEFRNPFAYLTQSCFNAFINVLTKYYRQLNFRRELITQQLAQLECTAGINSSKIINSFVKDYLGLSDDGDDASGD